MSEPTPEFMPPAGPTRATARLPGLEIEIVHRLSPNHDAEQVSINVQALPSFEAVRRWLDAANPFVFWMQATQMFWLPWLATANAAILPRRDAREDQRS